jgi:hypothetical protein
VLVVPVLATLGGPKAVLVASFVALAAMVPFRTAVPAGRVVVPVLLVVSLVAIAGLPSQMLNKFRLRKTSALVAHEPIFWNSFSMVGVNEDQKIIIDSSVLTEMLRGDQELPNLRRDFSAAAHRLRPGGRVMVIGAGGGRDIRVALAHGQPHVRAVEVNPLVVHMANEQFGDFTGRIYEAEGVEAVIGDARSYLANTDERFDVVLASLIDTWAASAAGAFALTENLLYTSDAFLDYYEHLNDDGVLSVSRWHPQETTRLLATGLEAWREAGAAHPREHAAMLLKDAPGYPPTVTLLMKRSPLTAADLEELDRFATESGSSIALTPARIDSPVIEKYLERGEAPWPDVDVEPVPDDRPFFFSFVRPSTQLKRLLGLSEPGGEMIWFRANIDATRMLIHLFLGVIVLLAFTVAAPLALGAERARVPDWAAVVGYFACLGLGYILIEIGLLQRLILLLGKPVYALAVILSTMLLASGLGSLASGRLSPQGLRRVLPRLLGAVTVVLALYSVLLPSVIDAALGAPLVVRFLVSVALVALPAFVLGMPFPSGLRLLEASGRVALVPWAWAVNGGLSVMASVAGIILAIEFGYTAVFLLGTLCYLCAAPLLLRWARPAV